MPTGKDKGDKPKNITRKSKPKSLNKSKKK